jgi:hypothetical protein
VGQTRQRIVEGQTGIAAQAEEDLDAVRFKHFHCGFSAGKGLYTLFVRACHVCRDFWLACNQIILELGRFSQLRFEMTSFSNLSAVDPP